MDAYLILAGFVIGALDKKLGAVVLLIGLLI